MALIKIESCINFVCNAHMDGCVHGSYRTGHMKKATLQLIAFS